MNISKKIRYAFEGVFLLFFYGVFKILPLDMASGFGGFMGRSFGRFSSASKTAAANLSMTFPEINHRAQTKIITDMWDNLGRTFGEYPHLKKIAKTRTTIENVDIIQKAAQSGRPVIFISGHFANWEVIAPAIFYSANIPGMLVYRPPNNPVADWLLRRARGLDPQMRFTTKSSAGARDMLKQLKNGGHLGLLIDQKFNKGLPIPLFGHTAMTSPAFVELAQKFNAALIPIQIERLNGAKFKLIIHNEIEHHDKDIENIMKQTHILLESWIEKVPAQWLWIHRRWPKKS